MAPAQCTYLDGPFGQIHIHQWGDLKRAQDVLICLPPSPYTGRAYTSLGPEIIQYAGRDCCVIAVDYPRFDGKATPSISDYAQNIETVMREVCSGKHVTLLGFHTGCLVAVETSLQVGERLKNLILIDVPFFDEVTRETLKAKLLGTFPITYELMDLHAAWDLSVTRQKDRVLPKRALEMFVDHISAGLSAGEPFQAAFSYDCQTQFSKVTVPCHVIATQAGLYTESLKTAKVIAHAKLTDAQNIKESVLEKAAKKTARHVLTCLDTE